MRLFLNFLITTAFMGILGCIFGFFYVQVFRFQLFGGLKAGIIVGTLGCILGGFIFNMIFEIPVLKYLNEVPYLQILLVNKFDINFIAAFLGTWMFLFIYKQISTQNY